jgi:hypothetical protein
MSKPAPSSLSAQLQASGPPPARGAGGALLNWGEYLDLLKPHAKLMEDTWAPHSEQLKAELYKQLIMNIALGYFLYFQGDEWHPDWAPFLNSVFMLQPNPDTIYWLTAIPGEGTFGKAVYRITGERGSNRILNFSTGAGMMGMKQKLGPGMNDYNADHFKLDPNGRFDVIFSGEKPAGYTGDWCYLNPKAEWILARAVSYDWKNERDPRLAIERLDAPLLRPAQTKEIIDARIRELFSGFVPRLTKKWLDFQNKIEADGYVNKFELSRHNENGTSKEWQQTYWQTVYQFNADEALVLETDLPKNSVYWNIQIADMLWNQVEFVYRQSSLNGHQARIDSDGKFRAVISVEDPGIANWLDTGGYLKGVGLGRWFRSDSEPTPTLKKVKLADVRKHLPADTPAFSAEDRKKQLRERREGAQLRRRW